MERRTFNPDPQQPPADSEDVDHAVRGIMFGPADQAPQLALFDPAKPAPGTVQPRRTIALDDDRAFGQPHRGHGDLELEVDKAGFLCGCTEYSRERPPSSGYWELKQRSARQPDGHNWWYAATINAWHRGVPQQASPNARFVPHAELMQAYEWRGLRAPWPGGYPYELEKPAFGAPVPLGNMAQAQKAGVDPIPVVGPALLPVVDLNPNRRRIAL